MSEKKLFRFMINGNLEYVPATNYEAAKSRIRKRELRRIGRANITDAQIRVNNKWYRINETDRRIVA